VRLARDFEPRQTCHEEPSWITQRSILVQCA